MLVPTLIVDGLLLLYRCQFMASPIVYEVTVIEESGAASTEAATAFAATVGQEGRSGAKNTSGQTQHPDGEK